MYMYMYMYMHYKQNMILPTLTVYVPPKVRATVSTHVVDNDTVITLLFQNNHSNSMTRRDEGELKLRDHIHYYKRMPLLRILQFVHVCAWAEEVRNH